MASSTDSDEETHTTDLLAAVDPTLLTDEMFQKPALKLNKLYEKPLPKVIPSQRYLPEDANVGADIILPEPVQRHVFKKLSEIIRNRIEFHDIYQNELISKPKAIKSKIKLFKEADCYVKPYEEFEFVKQGPQTKPNIKRKRFSDETSITKSERFQLVSVDAEYIYSGIETKYWAEKPQRSHKFFEYKRGADGKCYAKNLN